MRSIVFLISLLFCSQVFADVYIVTDKNTKDVISISSENDCIITGDMKLEVVKTKNLKDIQLTNKATMYTYEDGKFKLNMVKAKEIEDKELEEYEKNIELNLIKEKLREIAIEALKAEGHTFKHYGNK